MPHFEPRSSHPQRELPPTFHALGTFLTVHRLRPHHNTPLQGREDLSPSANGKGKIILPTRNVELAVFTNTPSVSRLRPSLRQSRASLFTAALGSAVNKDRFGLRVERLRPPSALRLRRHPSCIGGWLAPFRLRLQTLFGGYVSLRCQPETSACYSGSSMPCRRSPSSARSKPTISTFSHPQKMCRLHSKPSAFAPTPGPDVRCADVLTLLRQTANRLCLLRVASGSRHGGVG